MYSTYNARNSAAVKLVTKASQWRKMGTRGKKVGSASAESVHFIIRRQRRTVEFPNRTKQKAAVARWLRASHPHCAGM
ncbi:hypothetical protein EVAR_69833_1 [Eumeta japonica]|uniref:Uncharacterized protein n=1 Tax=Eumeta variegata TaxID=151549 RepID=A0A4C2A0A9_EUMVA|nr:hypothetical protein EVAR_69833_1 [Eumeta japonica]